MSLNLGGDGSAALYRFRRIAIDDPGTHYRQCATYDERLLKNESSQQTGDHWSQGDAQAQSHSNDAQLSALATDITRVSFSHKGYHGKDADVFKSTSRLS